MRMVVFSAVLLMLASGAQAQDARSLDDFESTDGWKVVASDQVGGALRVVDGAEGVAHHQIGGQGAHHEPDGPQDEEFFEQVQPAKQ